MEIREFARRIVETPDVTVKLTPPASPLTDEEPCLAEVPAWPARPAELEIVSIRRYRAPRIIGWQDPAQRKRILHALVNHEFQAAELFAWALLAFPRAPAEFRRGLLTILQDEQRHTRMYMARLDALGSRFGEFPVTGHFWNKAEDLTTPERFVCAMSLTFENANLDHTVEYAEVAERFGDPKTRVVIDRVHRDEIEHVRFGWTWLGRFKRPEQSMWEAYEENLCRPLHPGRASGKDFHLDGRRAAGLDDAFLEGLLRARERTDREGRRTDRDRRETG